MMQIKNFLCFHSLRYC